MVTYAETSTPFPVDACKIFFTTIRVNLLVDPTSTNGDPKNYKDIVFVYENRKPAPPKGDVRAVLRIYLRLRDHIVLIKTDGMESTHQIPEVDLHSGDELTFYYNK